MLRLLFITLLIILHGCRGYVSEQPPFHVNPNMDTQPKGKAYRENTFFNDKMSMRPSIDGTVAFGKLKEDTHYYQGKINNEVAKTLPKNLTVDLTFLQKGQKLYNQTCSACHSYIGDGAGLVGKRLMVKPTSFHSEYMYMMPPGHFFDVISNGIRTMQPYSFMLNEEERWAIVLYIRTLQISQDVDGSWINRSLNQWKQ